MAARVGLLDRNAAGGTHHVIARYRRRLVTALLIATCFCSSADVAPAQPGNESREHIAAARYLKVLFEAAARGNRPAASVRTSHPVRHVG